MNLKLRFKNLAVFVPLLTSFITFIYQVLGILNITTPVSEDLWLQLVGILANILVSLGILVDPTTKGIKDSERAKTYKEPRKDV